MKQLPVKKLLALGLGAAVSLSLLASCGGRSAETPAPESGVTPSAAQTAAVEKEYSEMTIEELKPLLQTVTPGS